VDSFLIVLSALVAAAIGFGIVSFTIGRDPGLTEPEPDSLAVGVPTDRPLGAEELERARFDVAIRGYRMAQVDRVIAASTATVRVLERRVGELEEELAELRGYPRKTDEDAAREVRIAPGAELPAE
jgi:DivIVA domain-containing protein